MTDKHTALYRKYRPSTFADVKNQEHIVSVLEGALKKKSIPHALLFTGSRGTGKTSVARIFAAAIGASEIDTHEMDAASNRGIDDIRELRDAVHASPYESPYKVYIIDEVHMLTKDAFNALLKTLEEPPAHVVFILATTEEDKLLDTIKSRCQIFNFRAPSRTVLRDVVLEVSDAEGVSFEQGAADLVAIAADGSFRDALSITQKVLTAATGKKVTADDTARIISAPRQEHLMELITALHSKDRAAALQVISAVMEQHADMKLFLRLVMERIRTVMLLRYKGTTATELQGLFGEEELAALEEYAADAESNLHSRTLRYFLDAAAYPARTFLPQLPLELAVIEATE